MMSNLCKARVVAAVATLGALASACSPETGPTSPGGGALLSDAPLTGESVWVCKVGPVGTTADFTIAADGPGTLPLGTAFTLNANPECTPVIVWISQGPPTDPLVNTTLTVTEVGATPGMELASIDYAQYMGGLYRLAYAPETSATITANFYYGGRFKFTNVGTPTPPPPPPPGGGEGCTPGYWKQKQHFDSWPAQYTTGMAFNSVFAGGFPGKSLLDVLGQGGGGLIALGRHTVAALLNAASSGVDYDLAVAGVIAAYNAAYQSGDYEAQKNIFAGFNEQGCPLN